MKKLAGIGLICALFLFVFYRFFYYPGDQDTDRKVSTLPGFTAEKLFEVPTRSMGSWVGMTVDSQGRLITSSQYKGIYRVTLKNDTSGDSKVSVEPLDTELRGVQGVLYAFDSLYALVGEKHKPFGLYRLTDSDNDDQFDKTELLREFEADGEHGLHSLVLSPDAQSIYIVAGNTSELPEDLTDDGPARIWQEDLLLPRMWDARGHAKGRLAPGGYILKSDRDGKKLSVVATGFRNQFDAAFTASGELITFDSDMEWDIGMPWYKPTRILHVVSGADYGWRSGSGKWPDYYPDTLPPVINMGLSSPTGLTNGVQARFPARYQRAIFVNDWTYGTMYAIHLKPDGASFTAEKEEFVTGTPLPLTDVVIRPQDGAMYFLVGGRRGQSALYRISYTGSLPTTPVTHAAADPGIQIRRTLEGLHLAGTTATAIDSALSYLSDADRFIRHAARVALEKQPADLWAERAFTLSNDLAIIEGMVALARVGDSRYQARILETLLAIDFADLKRQQALALLRAYQLTFTRMGRPESELLRQRVIATLDALYPSMDNSIDRELAQLLLYLDAPGAVGKTVQLLLTAGSEYQYLQDESVLVRNEEYRQAADDRDQAAPNTQQIALAFALRTIENGWTEVDREAYFRWYKSASAWSGGMSLEKFIQNMRKDALANISDRGRRAEMAALSKEVEKPARRFSPPKGPGRQWTVDEALQVVEGNLQGRNFYRGENLFYATACASCHRFAGNGGGIGPDITGSANRYTVRDMLEHIITPSRAISDQYGSEKMILRDGSQLIGRIGAEESGVLHVMSNPFMPESVVEIPVGDVAERERWPVSPMPSGLINGLNADELRDLIAYLFSGGNSGHSSFAHNKGELIFDGETLAGWHGDEALWSVRDGAIVGNSHKKKLKASSYLIWQGGEVTDFHLAFDVRLEGNNSGMQYRSEVFADDRFRLRGYQADVHPQAEYTGMLYGEAIGRDIIATRGNEYVVDEQTGKARKIKPLSSIEPLDLTQWHTFEIIAKGNHLVHKIDGEVVLDLTDNHSEKRQRGLIGMQLHAGEGMKVWYRNIRLENF